MNAQPQPIPTREHFYRELQRHATPSPNGEWLARIVASWCAGEGALPDGLGLPAAHFAELLAVRFPGFEVAEAAPSGRKADFSRMLEREDLVRLLHADCVLDSPEREWLVGLLVAGCLGSDHLWQDLGLWSRADLSALIGANFPGLAARNVKDMKWKKFLYKQLCESEGIFVCRSPTCEVCADYHRCYGPEE
jgi:nitrogen fixation protein NifQ